MFVGIVYPTISVVKHEDEIDRLLGVVKQEVYNQVGSLTIY